MEITFRKLIHTSAKLRFALLLCKRTAPCLFFGISRQVSYSSISSSLAWQTSPEFDVVIIGAGAIGSSTAYWLKRRAGSSLNVLVIDKDLKFQKTSTVLSVGGVRQQFSLKENVELSRFGAEFIQNANRYLSLDEKHFNLEFKASGYLTLCTDKGVHIMKENHVNQNKWGGNNELLTPDELKQRFPWLNTKDVALGCLGRKNEGWFDPWSFLTAVVAQTKKLGVCYVEAEAMEFLHDEQKTLPKSHCRKLKTIVIKTSDGQIKKINFSSCIVATGADTGDVTKKLLSLDKRRSDLLQFEIPIERRKRFVYCFESPVGGPEINSPMIIDSSKMYVRREGVSNSYICGHSPSADEEPDTETLDVDYDYFTETIWPLLAARIPNFEKLKLKSAWAGYYDYNYLDENGIVGYHPAYANVIIAAGFSGHGLQHAPGVGRAVSELLLDGHYSTIDLTRLSFIRVINKELLMEREII